MALDLSLTYPGQIDTSDLAYPYGKARNITLSGDGTGTPWEKKLANDILGFQQALLVAAGITPSNTPDSSTISQYLEALRYIVIHTPFDDGALIDGTLTLRNLPELNNGSGFIATGRVQPIVPLEIGAGTATLGGAWRCNPPGAATVQAWYQHTSGAVMVLPLTNLVHGGDLVSVRLVVAGTGGPGGPHVAVPSVMPKAQLFKQSLTTGAYTTMTVAVNDPAGTVANLNAVHFIDMVPVSPDPIDNASNIFVRIDGAGTGFEADKYVILGCIAQFHAMQLTPG
jgi:hypothetical protein